ncbi:hypothetical protein ACP4OV_014368 [Aristida adscensionis]
MTCGMAAGKQKKRLISSTNSEQYKPGKKSKFHSSNFQVNLKPHIGLKWDQYLRRVVSEKEQVGLLWSDLAPFIESQKLRSGLADVIYVPPETFSFENLRGVLSHEAWSTCLTESERKFLIQFLPSDNDAEENVHSLLTGKNYHFGNPFMNWSTSLCRGDMHPDAVLNKEMQIRNDEKAYSIDLRNYHSNMVETLKRWRKRWLSCGDTDNLFRDNPAKQKQGVVPLKASKSVVTLKVAPSVDISKFMSYIEISRTQLNHIKRLKQSGDGIQAKHVSRVIGGLDKIHVKPYGALVEGEKQRLREHWLNMLCNDLPAALKTRKERKMLMENSRKLLGDELGEKNVSVLRKADRLADITKELGQHGACENDGSLIVHDDQLEHSSQSMSQDRNDHRTPLQDQDDDTKYMETSLCHNTSPTVKEHDLIVVNGTHIISESEQKNSDMHAQINKDICCADEGIPCCVIKPSEENVVLMHKDGLNVQDEDIKEISYKDTTLNNLLSSESQQLKSTNCTSTSIPTLDRENMRVQDLDGVAYAGPSIHAHEQDHSLKSISHATINHNGHGVSFSAENSHPKMNGVTGDQEESDNTVVIPSNSSSLLSKPSVGQSLAEDFLDPDDQLARSAKGSWQLAGPVQSYYHPPENRMYNNDSGDLQIKQRYLSSTQQSSSIYVANNVFNRQQAQVATIAFPVDNSASFIEPISNCLNNGQLQIAMDIGTSNSLQHADSIEQSTGLQSFSNNSFDQSVPILKPLQDQPLIGQSQDDLYVQLHNNLYSDARFQQAKGNHPVAEQQSCHVFPPMDNRYNLFPEGNDSHNNNLSVMEPDNYLTQTMPTGSNSDGSLFSALSQFKQPSVHMQPVRSSPSQLLETRNQVYPAQTFVTRTQDTNPLLSNIYGYTRNAPSGPSSLAESVGSLNNMPWTNFIQQNPGTPDLTNRQFRGPWTR